MTTKHTPGPWVVDDDGDVCADDLERLVATVDWRHVSLRNGEAIANARLIAAAPDLLAALDAAHGYLVMMGTDHADHIRSVCRSAMAKARGQQ